jgi:enediyne biosynthesis protein E4
MLPATPLWFNPSVTEPHHGDGAAARRPAVQVAALLVAMCLAGAGCGDDGPTSTAGEVLPAPAFVNEAAVAGVEHAYDGEFEFFVGGGVAAFDCDDDGLADLYFAGGSRPAALFRNRSAVGGALRFTRTTSAATDLTAVTGAYPLDVDSDRIIDLVVLRRGISVVLRGLGDCAFEDATERFGLATAGDGPGIEGWTAAFSATWEGSNHLPTLVFGRYLVPETSDCADSMLFRPGSTGRAYAEPIALAPGYCTLSVLFSDWSRSGRRDLRVTNDRHYYRDGQDQLWRIEPGESPRQYTESDGWRPLRLWGMGIASRDVTGDGLPEVFLTSQGDNKLQTLDNVTGAPVYRDVALELGVTAQRPFTGDDVLPSTAWHPEFEDVNNDGLVDLFVTKGNVEAQVDYASRDPNNLFIGQADGTFAEGAAAAGIVDFDRSRGAALVDLNVDGMLDLVVVNRRANVEIWRNVGRGDSTAPAPMGHWVAVGLQQPAPNVDAIGAWVEVRVGERIVAREVTVGGGHAGGKLGWIHVGLGSTDDLADVAVRVQWPDGETGRWMAVSADQFVTIDRDAADVSRWSPGDRAPTEGDRP